MGSFFDLTTTGDLLGRDFVQQALVALALLGLLGGLLSPLIVARQMSFAVHGVSELSVTGAAAALLAGFSVNLGGVIGAIVAALTFGILGHRARERDSVIGVVMAFGLGLAVLFLALYGNASTGFAMLTGQVVSVGLGGLTAIAITTVVVIAVLAVIYRPLLFASVDPRVALAGGVPTRMLSIVFAVLMGLACAQGVQIIGALLVMGIATVLIGVLPTYAQVGIWAPIMLTAIRIVQGLAFGAEWGGAILMTFEHAPWKQRGRYTAIPQAGVPLGVLLANVVFLFSSRLDSDLAWRLPFLLSSVLIVAGMIIRLKVSESPEFLETKAAGEVVRNPLKEVFKNDWRNILRVIALRLAESGGFYVIVTYMLSYLTKGHEPITTKAVALTGLVTAAALGTMTTILFGALSDKVGRRPVYFGGWHDTPVYWRDHLPLTLDLIGPAIIEQMDTTVIIDPGARVTSDADGNLIVEVGA